MKENNKPTGPGGGGFGSFRWIFYALLAALVVGSLMMAQSGNVPDWQKCRESLFQQMFSDQCTPRRGFAPEEGGTPGGSEVPADPNPGKNI